MMTLSNQVGEKLYKQCQAHFDASAGTQQGTLLIKRLNVTTGKPECRAKGFECFHSGQFKFQLLKNRKCEYTFKGDFEGFYGTTLRIAEKITAFPTPANIEYSAEMSI
jgi:hypothetical protein